MGISLSNHEDRIKALENKTSPKWRKLYHASTPNEGSTATFVNIGESLRNFDFIAIEGYIVSWKLYVHLVTTPAIFFQTASTNFIYCLYDSGNNTMYFKLSPNASNTGLNVHILGFEAYVNHIQGLKLYYNFSYNIYALVVSISKSFLKCLTNSFKGGVKEIWQLV